LSLSPASKRHLDNRHHGLHRHYIHSFKPHLAPLRKSKSFISFSEPRRKFRKWEIVDREFYSAAKAKQWKGISSLLHSLGDWAYGRRTFRNTQWTTTTDTASHHQHWTWKSTIVKGITSQHKNRNTYCAEESSPQLNRKKAQNRLLRENKKLIKAKMTKAAAK
jgi:hypothetical protein